MIFEVISPSLSGHSWNLTFFRDLYDWKVDMLAPLLSSLEEVFISQYIGDKRIWILESESSLVNPSSVPCFILIILIQDSPLKESGNLKLPPELKLSYGWLYLTTLIPWSSSKEDGLK